MSWTGPRVYSIRDAICRMDALALHQRCGFWSFLVNVGFQWMAFHGTFVLGVGWWDRKSDSAIVAWWAIGSHRVPEIARRRRRQANRLRHDSGGAILYRAPFGV